jgi:surface antigen
MRILTLSALLTFSLVVSGCQQTTMNKENVGTVGGAVVGGVLGSQVGSGSGRLWATGAGVLLGALVGSEIGASLDRADRMYMQQANQRAHTAPIGETVAWNNPESGHRGTITPVRDGYAQQSNSYCREYEQTIYIDGRAETGVGTACQEADGRWRFVN